MSIRLQQIFDQTFLTILASGQTLATTSDARPRHVNPTEEQASRWTQWDDAAGQQAVPKRNKRTKEPMMNTSGCHFGVTDASNLRV